MRKSAKILLASSLILLSAVAFCMPWGNVKLAIATGTADAWGNHIEYIQIYQNSSVTGTWVLKANVTYAAYTSGYDVDINPLEDLRFYVIVWTRTVGNTGEALAYTRVYLTVTGQFSNALMSNVNASEGWTYVLGDAESGWYSTKYYRWNGSETIPAAGVTYQAVFRYQVYFDPDAYDQL